MDINSATEAQLKTLPGIGDAYSKKIIAGRPYARKDQLVSKNIVPQATYDNLRKILKDRGVLCPSVLYIDPDRWASASPASRRRVG